MDQEDRRERRQRERPTIGAVRSFDGFYQRDQDELLALVHEAEEILADQVVIIPIYGRLDPGVVWADEIGGYVHNPSQASDLWNVECWYRVDRDSG